MQNNNQKKGRGRPYGSKNSVYGIKLVDLCSLFKDDTLIPVSKHFAHTIKLINSSVNIKEIENTYETISKKIEEEKIDFKVVNNDEESN